MGAIHELRADYRHYRLDNPQFRWVFILADVLWLSLKLALFAGFLVGCWFIATRGALPGANGPVIEVQSSASSTARAPALTAERIALLESIAGRAPPGQPSGGETASESSVGTTSTAISATALVRTSLKLEPASTSVVTETNQAFSGESEDLDADPLSVQSISIAESVPVTRVVSGPVIRGPVTSDDEAVSNTATASSAVGELGSSDWILQQPSANYTVQIALTSNRPFLESFAGKLPEGLATAIYPERRTNNGSIQYSLSMGSFSSQFAAQNALTSLPEVHRRYGAHLRRFGEIQGKVVGFNRNAIQ